MNKWLKSGLFLLLTANMLLFAEDKNKDAPQLERPAFDNKVQFLVPGTKQVIPNSEVIRRVGKQAFESTDTDLSVIPLDRRTNVNNTNSSVDRDDLWPLSHISEGDAYYYLGSGAAGDTFSVVLTPAAPAVVTEVYYQWFSAGNCVAFGSDYGTASELSANGDCAAIGRGSTDLSPIGQLRTTPTPNSIAGYVSDWSADALLDIGGTFIVGDSTDLSNVPPFVISFVKGGDTPQPLAANNTALGRSETFTWLGGPWNAAQAGAWGRYHSVIENMLMVKVTYPWGAPMAIISMSTPPSTYAAAATVTINVDLLDDEDDNGVAIDQNDTLTYHYVDPAGAEHTGPLTATSAVGANGNGIYSFDITYSGAVNGDQISYWVTTKDNDDLESESEPQSFSIKAPNNPGADLLIILDSFSSRQSHMFEMIATSSNVVYELWDAQAEGGIDASVISHGWNNIIVYGWGSATIPAAVTSGADPGYGAFIDGGGNLLLTDMDWFWGQGLSAEPTFAAGDFAYDYFGLASGLNDPAAIDTVDVYGLAVSAMDSPFETDPLVLRHNLYLDDPGIGWIDYCTAGAGTGIFTDVDGAGVGVMMDHSGSGGGKAVYLSFMADAAGDTLANGSWDYTQFSAFVAGVFTEFGVTSPPSIGAVTGQTLSTASASAFPVTATVVDADEDAMVVTLVYKGSADTVWTSLAMTDGGQGAYSADIPAVDSTDVVSWYVYAGDASAATTYPDANTPAMSFFHHQPTTDVDVLYVDDNGYSAYFGNPGLSIAGTYDSYASYAYGATDGTIWAAYDNIVWNTDYTGGSFTWSTSGHELATFMAGGGNLLLLGDETLAGGYGWPGVVAGGFSAGEVAYDWFGLSSAWSDGNTNSPSYFVPVSGDPLVTSLPDTVVWANPFSASYNWVDQLCVGDFSYYSSSVTVADTASTTTVSSDTVETWDPDEGVWQAITTTTTTVTTVTSVTNDTLDIDQSAWFATRNNNGTSKAVFMPFYFTGIADEQVIVGTDTSYIVYQDTLMANVMSYFNDAAAPAGAAGFFGPEFGDVYNTDTDTMVVVDTTVTASTDSTNLGVDVAGGVPHEFAIRGNYPNPFNPETAIMFSLDITSPIVVKIYSILGQEISTLHSGILESGYHSMIWNGTDQFGKSVGSGVYIYRITSENRALIGKMMMLK